MTEGTDLVTIADETPGSRPPARSTNSRTPAIRSRSDEHSHPGPRQYVLIAIVLVILTGVEVATSYLDGHVNSNLLIVALGVMAAVKFFLVAAWYMHMKQDSHAVPALVHHRDHRSPAIVYGILLLLLLQHGPEVVGDRARRRRLSRLGTAPRGLAARRRDRGGLRGRGQAARSAPRADGLAGRHALPDHARSRRVCSRCGSPPTGRSTISPSATSSGCTWCSTRRTRSSPRRCCSWARPPGWRAGCCRRGGCCARCATCRG